MLNRNKDEVVPQVPALLELSAMIVRVTKRKRGKKDTSGDTIPSKPPCFGFFMDPISGFSKCQKCYYSIDCYTKWKEDGEPKREKPKLCPIKWEGRCPECEEIE